MSTVVLPRATHLTGIAPQFLVDDLERAIVYYRDRLGFELNFVYESFYASVSRDGFAIHLKHGSRLVADREHRKQNEHLDAYISVSGIRGLFSELEMRGARVIKPLEQRPWACLDFYVEDPDGYILCFSESNQKEIGRSGIGSSGHRKRQRRNPRTPNPVRPTTSPQRHCPGR